jgi:hypothetical protein
VGVVVAASEGGVVVAGDDVVLPPAAVSDAITSRGACVVVKMLGAMALAAGVAGDVRFSGAALGVAGVVKRFWASIACCLLNIPSFTWVAAPSSWRTLSVFDCGAALLLGMKDAPLLTAPSTIAIAAHADMTRRLLARKEVFADLRIRSLMTLILSHTFYVIYIADG